MPLCRAEAAIRASRNRSVSMAENPSYHSVCSPRTKLCEFSVLQHCMLEMEKVIRCIYPHPHTRVLPSCARRSFLHHPNMRVSTADPKEKLRKQTRRHTHTHTHTNTKRKNTRTHIFLVVSPEIGMHSVTSYSNPNSKDGESERRWSRLSCISLSLSLSHRLVVPLPYPWLAWMAVSGDQPKCGDATKSGQWEIRPKEETDIFTLGISRNSPGM